MTARAPLAIQRGSSIRCEALNATAWYRRTSPRRLVGDELFFALPDRFCLIRFVGTPDSA
jgi:hypothetical protein